MVAFVWAKQIKYLLFSNERTNERTNDEPTERLSCVFKSDCRESETFCNFDSVHGGDLHAVGWGEDPGALVTPVKVIRVWLGIIKNFDSMFSFQKLPLPWKCKN